VPLCVDLDGSLLRTDTLVEGLFSLGASRQALTALLQLLRGGKAAFKQAVANTADLDPTLLPYNQKLLAYLREQKLSGRRLVLATAADAGVAHAIAEHLRLFDEVIASNGEINLKGEAKARALVARFGLGGFAYVGDSRSDLPVWAAAAGGVTVNLRPAVAAAARKTVPIEAEIDDRRPRIRAALQAMRPYQWVKNLLVFGPIFTAHALPDARAWLGAIVLFAAFCVCASAIYIFNDLFDLKADRRHATKRRRPLANGDLPLTPGVAIAAALLCAGIGLASLAGALGVIIVYVAASLAYSVKLKESPLVDVFLLAGLYTIRLYGGGEATGYQLSFWLLAFSSFLFLSLALVKRVGELTALGQSGGRLAVRRGYGVEDSPILQMFGCAAAFSSCVVLALYVQSEWVLQRYSSPGLLWGIVPLMLFWQCRLWLSAARGYIHTDPIIYASRDWVSWLIAAALLALLSAAKVATINL
jgi:4-hydroxybenzoate polyprenyltransferase/phosphoserine phosphatase